MNTDNLLPGIPKDIRRELLAEFQGVVGGFSEGRWRSSALDAGRFCEVCYTVLLGMIHGTYAEKSSKPNDFRGSCRKLENEITLPKSFRFILLPILIGLYEIRNTRNVGHVDKDIDPSFMDGSLVVAQVRWVLAELVRHFHSLPSATAQGVVDALSQYSSPVVWSDTAVRRVLRTDLALDLKLLLLLSAAGGSATRTELFDWLDEGSKRTFDRRVASLHDARQVEAKAFGSTIRMLPPGNARLLEIEQLEVKLAA